MGHVNLGSVDFAYKMPESTKTGKETREVKDDFKKLLEEKQETGQEVTDKGTEDRGDSKEVVEEQDTETSENGMYALYQMNPLLQGYVKITQAEDAEVNVAGMDANVVTEVQEGDGIPQGAVQIPPEGEAQPQAAGNSTYLQGEAAAVNGQPKPEVQQSEEVRNQNAGMEISVSGEASVKPEEPVHQETIQNQKHTEKKAGSEKEKPEQTEIHNEEQAASMVSQGSTVSTTEFKGHEVHADRMEVRQPEEIPQKLAEQLLVKADKGVKEFEIQIAPENLGKIAVKILYENGQTTVSILCSEKKTMELLGQNAREIGNVMEQNLGDTTTIIVEKQETDYLNQERNNNDHAGRDSEQERQKEESKKNKSDNPEEFLQKLRLGLNI